MTIPETFQGFRRSNGSVGIRSILLALPVGQCANELALRCASGNATAYPFLHTQPCAHLGDDNRAAANCLVGIGRNANVAAVLVLGIGCDALSAKKIAERIAETGKPVSCLTLETSGSWDALVRTGQSWLAGQSQTIARQERMETPMSSLTLAVKCGGSDATSALTGNPAIGRVVDRLIDANGTAIFSETTELIGAEHILMARAANGTVRGRIEQAVRDTEQRIMATGVDPRGTQPTPGNIRGGLSTLEEKSLGGVLKTGSRIISGVFDWGESPSGRGLHMMDCPANVPQLLLGWAAAGAQLLVFNVGGGLPARIPSLIGTNVGSFPLLPTIKVLSNPRDRNVRKYFDIYSGSILEGQDTLEDVASSIWTAIVAAASGRHTYLERYGAPSVQTWEMLVRGPTV